MTESNAEFDNWAQDQAAMDLEYDRDRDYMKKEPAPVRKHEEWCGDPALSRPVDKCTCDVTPEDQARQNQQEYHPPGSCDACATPPDFSLYDREPSTEVARWADVAMYKAEPMAPGGEPVRPKVYLLSMTADPLRLMAAKAEMYRGNVVRNHHALSRETTMEWVESALASKIVAPLESVHVNFLIEGVPRTFTHQLVRQRTAVFVQESMRFAVKDDAEMAVALPAYLEGVKDDHPLRVIWNELVEHSAWAYKAFVNGGMPAEDARGGLLENITTRIHYETDLRHFVDVSENRLCSQAQFIWKMVFNEMIRAILSYGPPAERWQQEAIVRMLRPPCYRTGKCEFNGRDDRWCVIRDRVEAHHAKGEPPSTWTDIGPHEPLAYDAARRSQ